MSASRLGGRLQRQLLREQRLQQQGGLCVLCGSPLRSPSWEHLVPRSRGGTDERWNIALSCVACNENRGNAVLGPRQVRRVRRWFGDKVARRINAAHGRAVDKDIERRPTEVSP